MSDLISRQAAIDAVDNYIGTFDAIDVNFLDGLKTAKKLMMQLPSAQPERKCGKWEEKAVSDEKVIDEWQSARCSACGKYHTAPYMYYFNNYNFCPNCGARMTEEDV